MTHIIKLIVLREIEMRYRYIHEEFSFDRRTWEVTSDKPLSRFEVEKLCSVHGFDSSTLNHKDKTVEFCGTDYGDNAEHTTWEHEGATVKEMDYD